MQKRSAAVLVAVVAVLAVGAVTDSSFLPGGSVDTTYTVSAVPVDETQYDSTLSFEQLNASQQDEFLQARSTQLSMNRKPLLFEHAGAYISHNGTVYNVRIRVA